MLWCVCVARVLKRRVLFFLHSFTYFIFTGERRSHFAGKSHDPRGEAVAWLPVPRAIQSSCNAGICSCTFIGQSGGLYSRPLSWLTSSVPSSAVALPNLLSPPPSPVQAQFKQLFPSSPPPKLTSEDPWAVEDQRSSQAVIQHTGWFCVCKTCAQDIQPVSSAFKLWTKQERPETWRKPIEWR